MPAVIAVHPHRFDGGLLKRRIPKFVEKCKLPVHWVPDGDKEPYGGHEIYDKRLVQHQALGKYGRASLTDSAANSLIHRNDTIFLLGGYFDECVASTYNSLVRAAERKKKQITVIMITDLTYVQDKNGKPWTLQKVRKEKEGKTPSKMLQMFKKSKYTDYGYINARRVLNATT